jgi:prolyl-tRNA editing enzyme YbaK/EbsC (Cys-tRNA(Pro) deacylase)
MNQLHSTSAQKIQEALHSMGYAFKVVEFTESTRTAQDAAECVGCTLGQIVKSIIFKGRTSGKPILVLTSGSNRVDEIVISQYTGEPIIRADAEFVRATTGYAIGGVPPIGHLQKMGTFLDEDLFHYATIWAAAGTPHTVFELTPEALQKMTAGRTVSVKA